MKPTAKNIAEYANKQMDRPYNGHITNNISICLPNLNKNTFEALKSNYNFKVVSREFLGYIHFER